MSLIISSEFPNSDLLNLPFSFSAIPRSVRKSKEYLNTERNEIMEGVSGGVVSEVTERLRRTVHEKLTLPHAFEYLGKSEVSSPITFMLNSVDNIIVPYDSFKQVNEFKPHRDKTNKMACAPSEDSDQPGHPPMLRLI